jgi:hypothetical protein
MKAIFISILLFSLSQSLMAQSRIDSVVISIRNVISSTQETGTFHTGGGNVLLRYDEFHFHVVDFPQGGNSSLTFHATVRGMSTEDVEVNYDSLAATIEKISYDLHGGNVGLILDSLFVLSHFRMNWVGNHYHYEDFGSDVASHMSVTAAGRYDGGTLGSYDQDVSFLTTDSTVLTIDLYANILSGVEDALPEDAGRILLAPNPATDQIRVILPPEESGSYIFIYDQLGSKRASLRTADVEANSIVNIEYLTSGWYILRDSKGRMGRFLIAK